MGQRIFGILYVTITLISVAVSQAFAQVGPDIKFIPESDGLTITGPANGQRFRMKLAGDSVGRFRTKKKYWFRIDSVRFEFFSEENARFVMTDLPERLEDRVILDLYRSEFLRRNGDLKVSTSWLKLANGETAILMSYDKFVASPGVENGSEREMILAIAGPGHVFGLFAPVPGSITESEVRRALFRTLGSIQFVDAE